jgi:hypothetical protein
MILNEKPPNFQRLYTMSAERLELSTNGLKGHCSTIELRARKSGLHSIMGKSPRQRNRSRIHHVEDERRHND